MIELGYNQMGADRETPSPDEGPSSPWRKWCRRGFTTALTECVTRARRKGIDVHDALDILKPLSDWAHSMFDDQPRASGPLPSRESQAITKPMKDPRRDD